MKIIDKTHEHVTIKLTDREAKLIVEAVDDYANRLDLTITAKNTEIKTLYSFVRLCFAKPRDK